MRSSGPERVTYGAIALLILLGQACSRPASPNGPIVAKAYERELPWSELRQVIPVDAAPEDSLAMAQEYITGWLRDQVVLHKAEQNLSEADKDFDAQLRAYRNQLILFAYENALVEQKLDTVVTDEQVRLYYEENQKNFELKDNIVRVRWFKVREDDKRMLKKLENWFRSGNEDQLHELEIWLARRDIGIFDTGNDWISFQELRNSVPIETRNPTDLLSSDPKLVVRDSVNTYFVDILEHRLKESLAPPELVRQEIRAILINQRKLGLVERMHEDLYQEALERNEAVVY